MNSTGMFATNNSAYKQCYSIENLLNKINSDLFFNMDNQNITFLVLLDLRAAFDSVSQQKLLHIFKTRFRITNTAHAWLKSYFTDRYQCVTVEGNTSKQFPLKWGVPQGSCFGPVAYLAYTSAIADELDQHNVSIMTFADDTQLYLSFKASPKVIQFNTKILEESIAIVRNFMITHQLKINDSKTEFLVIGTKQLLKKVNLNELTITVGQHSIKPSTVCKILGVHFDLNMNLITHFCLILGSHKEILW